MASQSAHFNLTKPATTDYYNLGVFNDNIDIIDTQMYNNQQSAAKIMVGATSQDDGESGRVPAPSAGDEDKYLKANGTWDTPSGGGGSSTLSGLTDVDLSSPTNGQILKYNSTTQKWENADESGGSQRTYLGQLIPRVSASDYKITASTSNSNYPAWGAFNGISPSGNLQDPSSNSCWLPEVNLTNQYIQYHFDAPRYFTKIGIVCFSSYSTDWVGDIKIEGSNDGSTWENILTSGTTYELTAEFHTIATVEINLDDTDLWEYIRVTFIDAMSVAYQPSCFIDEIYVYGGSETSGGGSDITIVSRTDSTNEYAWLVPCDANGNTLKPSEVTLLSIFAEADMSGAPPYYNGLNVCVDTDTDRYYCKLYNTQSGGYASDGVYSVTYRVAYILNN